MIFFSLYNYVFLFFLVSSVLWFALGILFFVEGYVVVLEWLLLNLNSTMIAYTMIFDWMSLMFAGVMVFISSSVVFYSRDYMSKDVYMNRFVILVVLFVLSMLLVILSFNLMGVLLGWDGLGLISYCLVIYFQNKRCLGAGMLTALVNRLGDAFLIIGICWWLSYGSWNYLVVSTLFFSSYVFVFVLVASFTSGAQIPFSSWLPAAMAAPTPVSALVHSSTLVTAGIYLVIRFSFSFSDVGCEFFLFLALLTMLMGSICALVEFDLSKIVALSTLSQLGLMMSCVIIGFPELCFFHLLVHALFKSLMFLCVGIFIHGYGNNQDVRFMGLAFLSYPLVSVCFCISIFSLGAMPFLAGYYSSDLILEFVAMGHFNLILFWAFYLSACLTIIYTFRMIFYSLVGTSINLVSLQVGSESQVTFLGVMILSIASVVGGSQLSWLVLSKPLFVVLPFLIKVGPVLLACLGVIISFEYWVIWDTSIFSAWSFLISMNGSLWYLLQLSEVMGLTLVNWSYSMNYSFDSGWLEEYGARGVANYVVWYSVQLGSLSFNSIKLFFMWVLFLVILFMGWG